MKFVLGYLPGTKSDYWDGPQVYTTLVAKHLGTRYFFERWVRNSANMFTPELRKYESDDYPPGMIKHLLSTLQIVPARLDTPEILIEG